MTGTAAGRVVGRRFSPHLSGLGTRGGSGRVMEDPRLPPLNFIFSPLAPPLLLNCSLKAFASAKASGLNSNGPLGAGAVESVILVVSVRALPRAPDGLPKATGERDGASVMVTDGCVGRAV